MNRAAWLLLGGVAIGGLVYLLFFSTQAQAAASAADSAGNGDGSMDNPDSTENDSPDSNLVTGLPMAWGSRVSPEFRARVNQMSENLSVPADWIMAIMHFESAGTFSPSIRNSQSQAVGLIQFTKASGFDVDAIAAKDAVSQLDDVEEYFGNHVPLTTIEDCYMAVLYPVAIGRPNNFVLFSSPSREYVQNSGLDANGDGSVTKAEASAPIYKSLSDGKRYSA